MNPVTRDVRAAWSAAHPADLNRISEKTPYTGSKRSFYAVTGRDGRPHADTHCTGSADGRCSTKITWAARDRGAHGQETMRQTTLSTKCDRREPTKRRLPTGSCMLHHDQRSHLKGSNVEKRATTAVLMPLAGRAGGNWHGLHHKAMLCDAELRGELLSVVSSRRSQWRDMTSEAICGRLRRTTTFETDHDGSSGCDRLRRQMKQEARRTEMLEQDVRKVATKPGQEMGKLRRDWVNRLA